MIILRIILVHYCSLLEIEVPVHLFQISVQDNIYGEKRYFMMSSTPNSILHFSQSIIISLALMRSNLRARKNLLRKKQVGEQNGHRVQDKRGIW